LAIGMAAVPSGNMPTNPTKETVDSLGVIRLILDNAKNIEEALNIFKQYNIDYGNGPDLHYLIADRTGQAVLVEFYQGEMHIIYNQDPWHLATNFLCSAHVGSLDGNCWRYDRVFKTLEALEGKPTSEQAMELLDMVSQQNTQWSVLYQLSTGEVDVVMGKNFKEVETFRLTMEIN